MHKSIQLLGVYSVLIPYIDHLKFSSAYAQGRFSNSIGTRHKQ